MLRDEATERLQRLLAIRLWDGFPELIQCDRFRRRLRREKKGSSRLGRMAFLLELCCDTRRANRQAVKERKLTIAES
jgi:hypothetical protein